MPIDLKLSVFLVQKCCDRGCGCRRSCVNPVNSIPDIIRPPGNHVIHLCSVHLHQQIILDCILLGYLLTHGYNADKTPLLKQKLNVTKLN